MAAPRPKTASGPRGERSFGRIVIDDLKQTRFDRSLVNELQDLYRFYLDDETRSRLSSMGRVKRAFWLLGWLLKSLYLKLGRGRRLALLLALLFAAMGRQNWQTGTGLSGTFDFRLWGFVLLLLIFMLELKDKLLARDEIDVARRVQLALLPQEEPHLPGWAVWSYTRPANDVGGDLVDYVDFDSEILGVVLGDVAGKGLGAALLTAKLQATLRALVPEARSLDELGDRLNTILYRDGLDNRYATLFYAELERGGGRVRYLNAGHNPAFVLGEQGQRALAASALPLGMLEGTTYTEQSVDLEPGEMLVAYSDGLTEATDENGQEFGDERLRKLLPGLRDLPPDRAGRMVLDEVDHFLQDRRPGDDLSLVIVKRLES